MSSSSLSSSSSSSSSVAFPGEPNHPGTGQMFEFGTNSFLVWNAEPSDYGALGPSPWQFNYATLPQLPLDQPSNILKHIANPAEIKSPMHAVQPMTQCLDACVDGTSDHGYRGWLDKSPCAAVPSAHPANSDNGLGITNIATTPDMSSMPRSPVPAIVTQFATRTNTVDETQMPALEAMPPSTLPNSQPDPTHYSCNITPPTMGYAPNSTAVLQEPFQWHSPTTSISSSTSGPAFSHLGTPMSTYQPESVHATPPTFPTPQSTLIQQFTPWSPRSPYAAGKPQARKHGPNSFSRMSQQYLEALQKYRGGVYRTWPTRRKPPFGPCLSDSSLATVDQTCAQPGSSRAGSGRRRAVSAANQRPRSASQLLPTEQLQLPMFQPGQLSTSPVSMQTGFLRYDQSAQASPAQACLTPYYGLTPYITQEPQQHMSQTPPPGFALQNRPCEPPASDFHGKPPEQIPVYQAPQFDGDIYTPQYKRRNIKGEWEGWCGLCQPGQWHNLKNSRYWDDKLRNHGICARTKQKFDDPKAIRVVDLDGKVIDVCPERDERGELRGDEWVVSGLDGSLRKREGLCGCCGEWVAMDGVRTKAKGKSAGWWSHAYKCHERGRRADPEEYPDHAHPNASVYQPSNPFSQTQPIATTLYAAPQRWG